MTGPTGATGITGATGTAGSFSSDFAYAVVPGVSGGTFVANGNNILFINLLNQAAGSKISLVLNRIVINDTGYYQLSYGMGALGAANTIFRLNITDSAGNTFSPGLAYQAETNSSVNSYVHNITVIVRLAPGVGTLTTPPYTISLTNVSGGSRTIANLAADANNPQAYMTIVKLM